MQALLAVDGVSCRTCGAERAPRGPREVCHNCWERFLTHRTARDTGLSEEDDFNRWLARRLFLDVTRMKRTGVIGRCQAASGWLYGRRGYQCGSSAIHIRDGRPVCGSHFKATSPAYISDKPTDPYVQLATIMGDIAKRDGRFLNAMQTAIQGA